MGSLKLLLAVFLIGSLLFISSCKQDNHNHHPDDVYTCSMHPAVRSDKPGKCPVCGMDLVKMSSLADRSAADKNQITQKFGVSSNVETTKGEYKTMDIKLSAQGVVTYDTRFVYTISSRVGGRLEGVTTKYDYQQLRKGEKLVEIYSPELVTAQREYLFILDNETNLSIIESGKRKLQVMGFTESQIRALSKNKNVLYRIPVYSLYSGYVINTQSSAPSLSGNSNPSTPAPSTDMGMGSPRGSSASQNSVSVSSGSELIREGEYVQTGQALVKVVSAEALRIELNLPAAYSNLINKGESVNLDFGNGHSHDAKIDFVEPYFSEGQEFLKVRVYTNDVKNMHIGHLVDAQIKVSTKASLWVPRSSIVNLGIDQAVFVKEENSFRVQKVSAGIESNDWIQIKSGITDKEVLARNASYLVDSESFIRIKQE